MSCHIWNDRSLFKFREPKVALESYSGGYEFESRPTDHQYFWFT